MDNVLLGEINTALGNLIDSNCITVLLLTKYIPL